MTLPQSALRKRFLTFSQSALDWLFPPICIGCGAEGQLICPHCLGEVKRVPYPACKYCGSEVSSGEVCYRCRGKSHSFQALRTPFYYDGVIARAIQGLKYENKRTLGYELAVLLSERLSRFNHKSSIVVPMPLGRERRKEREYNQAELISKPLSTLLSLEHLPNALVRVRETHSQVGLNRVQRQQNVQGAFLADPKLVEGREVLLIDDVYTTGATITEAAKALLEAGARDVQVWTVAKAF